MLIYEGILWFLLATIAQLPATVSLCLSRTFHSLNSLHVQVFILLDLSRMFPFSPPHQRQLFIGPDSVQNDSSLESRMFLFYECVSH